MESFLTSITTALADFSTANLASVMTAALGITVSLSLAWFGYRFIVKRVNSAMKRGKLG